MIITCPACSKRYLVDDAAIDSAGRRVQCVSCDHNWFFKPTPGAKELEQVHLDLIGIQSSKKTKGGLNLGWILLLITLLALGFGIVMGRTVIEDKLPFTKPVYALMGLAETVDTEGLVFEDLRPMVEDVDNSDGTIGKRLMLAGVVSNPTSEVKDIKSLSIYVKGDCKNVSWLDRFVTTMIKRKGSNQCVLETWDYVPSDTKIYPGERVAFETGAPRAIEGAVSIQVQF